MKAAVKALKMKKSAGAENVHVPAELVKAGEDTMIDESPCLQQDREDRILASQMNWLPGYRSPKERNLADVPKLQNHHSYQTFKQSYVIDCSHKKKISLQKSELVSEQERAHSKYSIPLV